MKSTPLILTLSSLCLWLSSCNKLLEIPESKNQVETPVIFADSVNASAAVVGIYYTLGSSESIHNSFIKYMSLYTDELLHTTGDQTIDEFNQSKVPSANYLNKDLWGNFYSVVYQCNSVLEGIESSKKLSLAAKSVLGAEAQFLRAFANFYLLNLYDHIPLVLTTNVDVNRRLGQTDPQLVYDQIVKDLLDAKLKLPASYIGNGKVRANRWAASALLARVYLYRESWIEAEKEATAVINSGLYSPLPVLNEVFLANSKEAIFQLWNPNGFVNDVTALIPATGMSLPNYPVSMQLVLDFDLTDGRRSNWLSKSEVTTDGVTEVYFTLGKYKNRNASTFHTEYTMVLRLTEQYLIRAEAVAHLDRVSAAVNDLNVIRERATGLVPLDHQLSKAGCLNAVLKERRLELFSEWGHRFFDLKRTRQLDPVLGSLKNTWKSTSEALPIPQTEITYNSNLIQNNGY